MRRLTLIAFVLTALVAGAPARAATEPQVVVALIDTGINPYSPAFRDPSPLAQQPPSSYLPGYPPDCPQPLPQPWTPTDTCAIALRLSLDAPAYAAAVASDAAIWSSALRKQLYYVPGTRIVGVYSYGGGGTRCEPLDLTCRERVILDDHGHGTMTASRAVGAPNSLAPSARVVMIEGLGASSSSWASRRGWIDVQSNSWGTAVPAPLDDGLIGTFTEIARRHLALVASGNGIGFSGVAPTPTWFNPLGAAGVVLVGGHDNGRVTAWAGTPAHVVADTFAGYTGIHNTLEQMRPDPVACCTSAASPYAAGGAAAILLEARRILGDASVGVHDGIAARGVPPAGLTSGPLADGVFTLAEWRDTLLRTAQARPVEGRDDGDVHFMGAPAAPKYPQHGPGENPYCQGCWTLPVRWTDVPDGYPAVAHIGYGAINEHSVTRARAVLTGADAIPARPDEDAFFAASEQIRKLLWLELS